MWIWGHDGVLVMSFQFCESLMIINRLKWLNLLLTREKIVSLFLVWEWGHDDVLVMFFQICGCLMVINGINWLSLLHEEVNIWGGRMSGGYSLSYRQYPSSFFYKTPFLVLNILSRVPAFFAHMYTVHIHVFFAESSD